jgi:adenylate cyclase
VRGLVGMSDVFISYARSTAAQAQRIADALRALGYNVWRDDDLPAHRPYADVIDERLRGARAVVVVWSADAAKSQWVRAEADLARNAGTLVQLRIDDAIPPLPFNQIECADLSRWKGDPKAPGWRKVVASVADLTGAPPPTAAAPARAAAAHSRRITPRRFAIAAGALALVLAVAAVAVWRLVPLGPARLPGQNGRVDVVAFEAPAADPALRKVAEDTSGTLERTLAAAGVQTVERSAQQGDAGGDSELRVTGAAGREGDKYAIDAQILDRKSGVVLWTNRFMRTAQEQDAAPAHTARAISGVLHCALEDRKAAKTPVSTEAFGLYLNACAAVFVGWEPERMLTVARRLVKAAPQFANAHAMHAIAAANAANQSRPGSPETAALRAEAKAAAEQALKLDPRTPKAYAALAISEGGLGPIPSNWFAQEQYLKKALALDPDLPPPRKVYTTLLRETGRLDEAIEFVAATDSAADPRSSPGDARLALMLAAKGDLPGAETALEKVEAVSRTHQDSVRSSIAFWWGDPKAALLKVGSLAQGDQMKADCFGTYLRDLEAPKAAQPQGLPASCAGVQPDWRVRMLARKGDLDGAFAAYQRPQMGTLVLFFPEMKAFRRDPRFWPLAKHLGLVDYWVKSNHWPDFCAEPDLPYDCRKIAGTV